MQTLHPPLGGCKDQIGHGSGFEGHPCILADLAGVDGVTWFSAGGIPKNWLLMLVSPLLCPQKKGFFHPCILAPSLHPPFLGARMVNCCKVCKVCKDIDLMRVLGALWILREKTDKSSGNLVVGWPGEIQNRRNSRLKDGVTHPPLKDEIGHECGFPGIL